jgi:hypothetical protein
MFERKIKDARDERFLAIRQVNGIIDTKATVTARMIHSENLKRTSRTAAATTESRAIRI